MSWRDTRRALRWTPAGAVATLLLLQVSVSAQRPDGAEPRAADRLSVDLEVEVDGSDATFRWRFGAVDDVVVCSLDVDGDDFFDQTIENCHEQTRYEHSYDEAGVYFARLIARSRDGRSGRAVVRVVVDE